MPEHRRPNIVLILTDQMRGDCLGVTGHPVVRTPNLDGMARRGTVFTAAYSACPTCIAARASIFTGQRPATHGRLGYRDRVPWRYRNTLAEELRDAGYRTHCVGKTHFFPQRLPLGFDSQDSYEALQNFGGDYVNDYFEWLKERTPIRETDHGLEPNSWVGGVSRLPGDLHNNSWVVTRGIEFLERRDRSQPFFLNLSFHRPHAPLDPPREYLERWLDRDIPETPAGAWAARHDVPVTGPNAWRGRLPGYALAHSRRAYYAQIEHIDAQIGRFLRACRDRAVGPTWFLFTSDHGEMLGDHHLFRKAYAYEGSAKIPLIALPPGGSARRVSAAPVSQPDILPTLLEAAGAAVPGTVEGRSLLPLLSKSPAEAGWREYVHGEHSPCYGQQDMGMQFLADGREKYIWYTLTGEEQFFDLVRDPDERQNRAGEQAAGDRLRVWRGRMIEELAPRAEDGLSDGTRLLPGRVLPPVRPSLLRESPDGPGRQDPV